MQPDASMGSVAVNTDGMIGAMNPYHGDTQPDPVFAKRIVGSGLDLVYDLPALFFLFPLNRRRHAPGRIFAHLDHFERADRGLPLHPRLPDRDRIRPAQPTTLEVKEHPLRQVDLDQIGSFDGDDMTIVDMDRVAGMQPVCNLLAVVAGQYFGALTESRTDTGKRVAIGDDEIEFSPCDPMRYRRERRAGLGGDRRGRGRL